MSRQRSIIDYSNVSKNADPKCSDITPISNDKDGCLDSSNDTPLLSSRALWKKRKNAYAIGRCFRQEWVTEFPYIEQAIVDGVEWVRCKVCSLARSRDILIQCKYDGIMKHHGKKRFMIRDENGEQQEVIEWAPENKHRTNVEEYKDKLLKIEQKQSKTTPLHMLFSRRDRQNFEAKVVQMRSVFHLLKNGKAMKDYPKFRSFLLAQKVPLCPIYHWSNSAGWEFANYMNEALKVEFKTVAKNANFLSLSMDEVSAVDNTAWVAMHLYVVVNFQRKSYFLGIQKLALSADAETLFNVLLDSLSNVAGLSKLECARKLVCFGADGAAVMQGSRTGLGARLHSKFAPYLNVIHCMSHRTNLAYKTISDSPLVAKVELAVRTSYKFFSKSSKRCAAFRAFADGVTEGKKLLKDVTTRWISLHGPVKRLCEEYVSLVGLLHEMSFDEDSNTAQKASELLQILTDFETLLTLFALKPLLSKLNYLIKISQDKNIFIPEYTLARKMMQTELENLYLDNMLTGESCFELHKDLFTLWNKMTAVGSQESFLQYDPSGILSIYVKGKFIRMYVRKKGGRGDQYRKCDFKNSDMPIFVEKVKLHMRQVTNDLVAELRSQFPPDNILIATGIVFPQFWINAHGQSSISKNFVEKSETIQQYFCSSKTIGSEAIDGILDWEQLKLQSKLFGTTMYEQVKELEKPEEFGSASRLWQLLGSNTVLHIAISEYFKLAELCLCMILGSVVDERCFSTMNFIKNKLRNRLDGNLDAALRIYSCDYETDNFPYEMVYELWKEDCKRRGVSKTHVEGYSVNTTIMDEVGNDASHEENL